MDNKLWRQYYSALPFFPCPRCTNGRLKSKAKQFHQHQPTHVANALSEMEMQDVSEGRFMCFLVCDFAFCGEVVAVSGNYTSHEEYVYNEDTENHDVHENRHLGVRAMIPAPPIITWPKGLAEVPRGHLVQAFELFWINRGACANRLRIFIETFLDQMGTAREGRRKNGKHGILDLSERIDLLEQEKPGHKTSFDALRNVGNFGSHEGDADFDDLLFCFELLEDTLIELLEERRAKRQAKAEALIKRKGKPDK